MINLFHINNHQLDTGNYSNLLHDPIVNEFEKTIANFVGAKYAVSFNSATNAIFLALLNKNTTVSIPSMIPPVVINAIITSGNKHKFVDNIDWVGDSYVLHDFGDYKIVDSAQKIQKNQYKEECNSNDIMIFSFYPTKPIGSCDGGMIVSDNKDIIDHLRALSFNGMTYSENNWEREIRFPGYKMYMNSIQADIALRNYMLYQFKTNSLDKIREQYNSELGYSNTSRHLYRIRSSKRNELMKHLKEKGIMSGIHYEAAHLNPVYKNSNEPLPETEKESSETLSIPFHEKLHYDQTDYIIKTIKSFEDK